MARMIGGWLPGAVTVATALACAGPLEGQVQEDAPLLAHVGFGVLIAEPVGEFADVIGTGWGFEGSLRFLGLDGPLSARLDLGLVEYGRETRRVCLSATVGCRIQVDLVTSNDIFFGSLGPRLGLPSGPVRPYVTAGVGFAYFSTTSSISDLDGFDDPDFRTNNFDDVTFAWLAAAGFEIRLTRGRRPVALDVAVRYHANGLAEYLTEDDIVDQPDGSIRIFPNRSEANLVTFQIGAQIGLGGGGPEPGFQLRR